MTTGFVCVKCDRATQVLCMDEEFLDWCPECVGEALA